MNCEGIVFIQLCDSVPKFVISQSETFLTVLNSCDIWPNMALDFVGGCSEFLIAPSLVQLSGIPGLFGVVTIKDIFSGLLFARTRLNLTDML